MTIGLEIRPRESWSAIFDRYRVLDGLIASALDAIGSGDREAALLLAAGAIAKCAVLDDRLGLADLRDAGLQSRPPGVFRENLEASSRRAPPGRPGAVAGPASPEGAA